MFSPARISEKDHSGKTFPKLLHLQWQGHQKCLKPSAICSPVWLILDFGVHHITILQKSSFNEASSNLNSIRHSGKNQSNHVPLWVIPTAGNAGGPHQPVVFLENGEGRSDSFIFVIAFLDGETGEATASLEGLLVHSGRMLVHHYSNG